jgi:hypothetical protein
MRTVCGLLIKIEMTGKESTIKMEEKSRSRVDHKHDVNLGPFGLWISTHGHFTVCGGGELFCETASNNSGAKSQVPASMPLPSGQPAYVRSPMSLKIDPSQISMRFAIDNG